MSDLKQTQASILFFLLSEIQNMTASSLLARNWTLNPSYGVTFLLYNYTESDISSRELCPSFYEMPQMACEVRGQSSSFEMRGKKNGRIKRGEAQQTCPLNTAEHYP